MLVRFKIARQSASEEYERDIQKDLSGISSVPFSCERDYVSYQYLEMDTVIDFLEGRVDINGEEYPCIYAKVSENDSWTGPILVTGNEFNMIFEKVKGTKTLYAEDLINPK